GRLGDLFGRRRVFLLGIGLFTSASLACGVSDTQWSLIAARAVEGLGGALVMGVALSLVLELFKNDTERAKAMGIYCGVCSAGGSIGLLLGGTLTGLLNWHWVFFLNVPVGVAIVAATLILLPVTEPKAKDRR